MLNLVNGFTIFGLNIKFYGITMATAMLVGIILACKNAKQRGLKSDDIFDTLLTPDTDVAAWIFSILPVANTFATTITVSNSKLAHCFNTFFMSTFLPKHNIFLHACANGCSI